MSRFRSQFSAGHFEGFAAFPGEVWKALEVVEALEFREFQQSQAKSGEQSAAARTLSFFGPTESERLKRARAPRLPKGCDHAAKKSLRKLTDCGRDEELVLAASCLLAKMPLNRWAHPGQQAAREAAAVFRRAAEIARTLRRWWWFDPEMMHDGARAQAIQQLPETLETYAKQMDAALRGLKWESRAHLRRAGLIRSLGDHIRSRTGQFHWEDVANLISAFGSDLEDLPKLADARTLERAYERSA